MGFLSTLLYILLGFYIFRWLLRVFAPKIMAFAIKRLQKKMNQSFKGFDQETSHQPKDKPSKKKQKPKVGEYIDFEEIE